MFDGIRANSIADPDSVRVSSHAQWQVCYYLKKGQTDKAREIADFAGEVYSIAGLTAKGVFMEATTNYDGAFEWLAKIEERYNEPSPLMAFCSRYKAQTGDSRFDSELQKRLKALFPKGMENVSMNDFHAEPTDGVALVWFETGRCNRRRWRHTHAHLCAIPLYPGFAAVSRVEPDSLAR